MGLIIKKSLPMFKIGYPTVSDKYNVAGGILEGSSAVSFGDPVMFGTTKGYFAKAASLSAVTDLAGFVVATNVKLANFENGAVETFPGEAFNLLVNGFIAVKIDAGATLNKITANEGVAIVLATGALTTIDKVNNSTIYAIPNTVFTGLYENHGTVGSPIYVAEIYVK